MDGKIHPKLQSETVLPRMVYLPCLTTCHQRFSTYYDIFYILIYYVSSGTTVPPLCSLVWRKKCRKRGPFSGQPTSCTFPKTFQDSDVSAKKRYLLRSSWGSFPIQQDRGFGLDIKVLDVLQKPRLKTHYLTFNLLQSTGFRSQNIFHSIFKRKTHGCIMMCHTFQRLQISPRSMRQGPGWQRSWSCLFRRYPLQALHFIAMEF